MKKLRKSIRHFNVICNKQYIFTSLTYFICTSLTRNRSKKKRNEKQKHCFTISSIKCVEGEAEGGKTHQCLPLRIDPCFRSRGPGDVPLHSNSLELINVCMPIVDWCTLATEQYHLLQWRQECTKMKYDRHTVLGLD